MTVAHINRIGAVAPPNDIHLPFVAYARTLLADPRTRKLFERMAERAGIEHRFSCLRMGNVDAGEVAADGFYSRGGFPGTAARMARYETEALTLAQSAIAALDARADIENKRITHLIVASCTGFTAPGLDVQLIDRLGLSTSVQRTLIGFMGCSAAIPALRAARQIVLSDPRARVLIVNVELCTLHLQEQPDLEEALSFLLFGDGASAALVTADPIGFAIDDFRSVLVPDTRELITWRIGEQGFHMHLSGRVPAKIAEALQAERGRPAGQAAVQESEIGDTGLWAVHPGGRTVLDAVQSALGLPADALGDSRSVLREYGNMSSATVMFVLARMLRHATAGAKGLAMAFGPGMVAETFRFRAVG